MSNGAPGTYGSTGGGSKKLQQTHAQVNEVVDIMRENVEKVIDRDIKLSELDDRADALQQGASQFETQAAKLKRKYWWKNMKMWILLIAIGVVVVVIIAVTQSKPNEGGGNANAVPAQAPVENVVDGKSVAKESADAGAETGG